MGSSVEGKIYTLNAQGDVDEVARLSSGQVTALLRLESAAAGSKSRDHAAPAGRPGDVAVAGGNLGGGFYLRPGLRPDGPDRFGGLGAPSFPPLGPAPRPPPGPQG